MVDADLARESPPSFPLTKESLLSDLLGSPLVKVYRYSDNGPPEDVAPRARRSEGFGSDVDVYDGWVVATQQGEPRDEHWTVCFADRPDSFTLSGVTGDAVGIAAADGMRADGLAAQVASQGLTADMYVTERPYLHSVTWDIARGVVLCQVDEALVLLGLYLRAQGDFRVASMVAVNRGLYFRVATHELLPEGWRWSAACYQHAGKVKDSELNLLADSVFQRVARAIEARDRVHIALSQPQHNDTRQEMLARLDDVLIDLMGAVDATARVAHRVLGLSPDKEFYSSWQNEKWVASFAEAAPDLATVVKPGGEHSQTLTILRLLRNSVHGTALQGIALKDSIREEQSLVRLPPQDEAVLTAMDALGGRAAWGARQLVSESVHIDAGLFVDVLLKNVLELLSSLMSYTPVELLDGVSLTHADMAPPVPDPKNTGVWDEWVRTSIRWQLGF